MFRVWLGAFGFVGCLGRVVWLGPGLAWLVGVGRGRAGTGVAQATHHRHDFDTSRRLALRLHSLQPPPLLKIG